MIKYDVDRGEKVQVQCEVEANPPNVSFVWEFNNKSGNLSLPAERSTHNGTRSVIVFQPNSENDYGMLYCRARNILGEQAKPCSYHISPAGEFHKTVRVCAGARVKARASVNLEFDGSCLSLSPFDLDFYDVRR